MIPILVASVSVALGCGPAEPDPRPDSSNSSDNSAPAQCGQRPAPDTTCSFDGECSDYFVCIEGACAVPETMTGTSPAGTIEVNGQTFAYELAAGDLARERGLIGRPCMVDGWGLMLEWPDTADRRITMSGVQLDLDLVFLDDNDEVVSITRRAVAGSKALYGGGPARRVLEVKAGAIP